jgi:protein TonB
VKTTSMRARSVAVPMIALSLGLHGAAFAAASRIRPPPVKERIELEVVRREPAARPPPPAEKAKPAPRPRLVAAAPVTAPAPEPAPRQSEPPPALASAPATPPPGAARPLPKVGISLGSTVASGGFAVGVGNTVHGRAEEVAADPASVRPYAGGVPAARLSAQPRPLELPKIDYPADARRAGIEGQVVLVLRVDARGAVTRVRVVDAPAPSLAAAAEEGARRFRFTPALLDGEPVETEIRFTYTFFLE